MSALLVNRRLALMTIAAASPAWGGGAVAYTSPAADWLAYDARLRALLRSPPGMGFQPVVETALLDETNRFRALHGLTLLRPHEGLERAARAAAADMAQRRFFDHLSPEGHGPSERVGLLARRLCGLSGENIAFQEGGESPPTGRDFFEQWRDSAGHRENMLRPVYTHAGHGVIRVGARTYAAAALAAEQVRLAADLPLRLLDGRAFSAALAGADPPFDRFDLSAPDGSGRSRTMKLGEIGELPAGASRLRPYLPSGGNHFTVLWGPIFVVA